MLECFLIKSAAIYSPLCCILPKPDITTKKQMNNYAYDFLVNSHHSCFAYYKACDAIFNCNKDQQRGEIYWHRCCNYFIPDLKYKHQLLSCASKLSTVYSRTSDSFSCSYLIYNTYTSTYSLFGMCVLFVIDFRVNSRTILNRLELCKQ